MSFLSAMITSNKSRSLLELRFGGIHKAYIMHQIQCIYYHVLHTRHLVSTTGRVRKDTFLVLNEFAIILGAQDASLFQNISPDGLTIGSEILRDQVLILLK